MNELNSIHSCREGMVSSLEKQTQIKESAKVLFEKRGFKKTKISDIMTYSAMASGTFYNYYESKEALFMDIYNDENIKLKKHILAEVDLTGHPKQVLSHLMILNEQGMRSNPILSEWYNPVTAAKMEQYFREHDGLNQMAFLHGQFMSVIGQWQESGQIRKDISVDVIMTMFTGLIVLETHKQEVASDVFDDAFRLMFEMILDGLLEV